MPVNENFDHSTFTLLETPSLQEHRLAQPMILKQISHCTSIIEAISQVEVSKLVSVLLQRLPNILSSSTFVNAKLIPNVCSLRTIGVCFSTSWYVATFVPTSLSGECGGFEQIVKSTAYRYHQLGRVKLIRVWLGVADGLSALSSVCIRGSLAPIDTLPALFGLYQPELSSSVLHAFVLATLSVCMCVSVIQCPGPLLLHKEALLFTQRNSFSPHASLHHHLLLALILLNIHFLHFATENLVDDYITNTKRSRILLLPWNPDDLMFLD